jgi:hypothetical protein
VGRPLANLRVTGSLDEVLYDEATQLFSSWTTLGTVQVTLRLPER